MPDGTDLQLYILHGKEERYLEYKRSMIWTNNDTTKVKIAKAMMEIPFEPREEEELVKIEV